MRKGSKYWYAQGEKKFLAGKGRGYGWANVTWTWHGEEFIQLTKEIAEKKLEKTLEILRDQAKEDVRVDTGTLKDSIRTWEPRWEGDYCHGAYGIPKEHSYEGHSRSMDYGFYWEVGHMNVVTGKYERDSYLVPALKKKQPEIQALWRVG